MIPYKIFILSVDMKKKIRHMTCSTYDHDRIEMKIFFSETTNVPYIKEA